MGPKEQIHVILDCLIATQRHLSKADMIGRYNYFRGLMFFKDVPFHSIYVLPENEVITEFSAVIMELYGV